MVAAVDKCYQRKTSPAWGEQIKGVLDTGRIGQQQGALPEIVDDQRRHDQSAPGRLDRQPPEVPHVDTPSASLTRQCEYDGAEREKTEQRVVSQKTCRPAWVPRLVIRLDH